MCDEIHFVFLKLFIRKAAVSYEYLNCKQCLKFLDIVRYLLSGEGILVYSDDSTFKTTEVRMPNANTHAEQYAKAKTNLVSMRANLYRRLEELDYYNTLSEMMVKPPKKRKYSFN